MLRKEEQFRVEKMSPEAKLPTIAHASDAGYDFYCLGRGVVRAHKKGLLRTGVKVAVPEGHALILKEKSGISLKTDLHLKAGVIDAGFRAEVKVVYYNAGDEDFFFEAGDKLVQGIVIPVYTMPIVEDILESTERNEGGFGSTGV